MQFQLAQAGDGAPKRKAANPLTAARRAPGGYSNSARWYNPPPCRAASNAYISHSTGIYVVEKVNRIGWTGTGFYR